MNPGGDNCPNDDCTYAARDMADLKQRVYAPIGN